MLVARRLGRSVVAPIWKIELGTKFKIHIYIYKRLYLKIRGYAQQNLARGMSHNYIAVYIHIVNNLYSIRKLYSV